MNEETEKIIISLQTRALPSDKDHIKMVSVLFFFKLKKNKINNVLKFYGSLVLMAYIEISISFASNVWIHIHMLLLDILEHLYIFFKSCCIHVGYVYNRPIRPVIHIVI